MKVEELIEMLQKADPEKEVFVSPITFMASGDEDGAVKMANPFRSYPIIQAGEFSNWETGESIIFLAFDDNTTAFDISESKDSVH